MILVVKRYRHDSSSCPPALCLLMFACRWFASKKNANRKYGHYRMVTDPPPSPLLPPSPATPAPSPPPPLAPSAYIFACSLFHRHIATNPGLLFALLCSPLLILSALLPLPSFFLAFPSPGLLSLFTSGSPSPLGPPRGYGVGEAAAAAAAALIALSAVILSY
eukprot:767371-Hanusia_phi.AAC.1